MRTHAALWKLSAPRRCLMFLNSNKRLAISDKPEVAVFRPAYCLLLTAFCFLAFGCGVRFDMQDQPRYKAYKKSEFFSDNRASRNLPEGTVPRGFLKDNKA